MGYEDWTTYTEVDPGAGLTVVAQQITCSPIERDRDSYVYKDKGAAHFGNFIHYVDIKENGGTSDLNSVMMGWGLNNTPNDFFPSGGGNEALCCMVKKLAANIEIRLQDRGNTNEDNYVTGSTNTRYYLKMERTGLTAITCKIYSDAAHTVLVDTLSIVCQNTTYRYVYGVNSYNTGTALDFEGWTYNLDLQEVETLNPTDDANASDSITFNAGEHLADDANADDAITFNAGENLVDTAKASDVPVFNAGEHLADTAKASDSISFQMFHAHNIGDTAKASDSLTFDAEINLADIAKASDLYSDDSPLPPVDIYPCPTFTLHGTSTAILFPKPEWANPDNSIGKNVSLFNFKSGDLDTVDRGINVQPLTIGGTICICPSVNWKDYATMTTWLNSIKDAMNNGERFTINELGDCLNGVYVIGDFVFNTLKGTSDGFTWSLSLERVKDV